MNNINIVESFSMFKESEGIDRPTLIKIIEEVFKTIIRKKYHTDENFDIIVNDQTGDLEIFQRREVIADEDIMNDDTQIEFSKAILIDESYEIGDEVYELVDISSFGRRSVISAKQALVSSILEVKKNKILEKYKDIEGEIISGVVQQIWKKEIIVECDGTEMILPKSEQIKSDFFRVGDQILAIIKEIESKNRPIIILSRSDNRFLEKLLEAEVPEVLDGLISVLKVSRMAGEKAKVIVESYDDRIDPVGTCVGVRGSRISSVIRELKGEQIDIISNTNNINLLIQRSLSPATIDKVEIIGDDKCEVYMKGDQIAMAIGKRGANIKLAQDITGYSIDVINSDISEEYDIDLIEFVDEIDEWVIEELNKIGCDTARSVLALTDKDILSRTDLEESTIEDIRKILENEFA